MLFVQSQDASDDIFEFLKLLASSDLSLFLSSSATSAF